MRRCGSVSPALTTLELTLNTRRKETGPADFYGKTYPSNHAFYGKSLLDFVFFAYAEARIASIISG